MRHTFSTVAAALALIAHGTGARAQRTALQCALLGAERADACLRTVAERANRERDIERATALFVRVGALPHAEEAIERAWSRGPSEPLWNAIFTVARAHEERSAHRDALRWYRRWSDEAKRHASADVLAAVHAGEGQAWMALGQRALAYDAWRLAVHVWRAEHVYKLDHDGSVLNENQGESGYVAPERWTVAQIIDARRGLREGVENEEVSACVDRHARDIRAFARCLRALRPPPPPPAGPFAGLTENAVGFYSPFEGLVAARRAPSAHRTRSRSSAAAFDRGNRAAGEAWLGLLRVTVDEINTVSVPAFRGDDDRAFSAWERSALAPRIFVLWILLSHRATRFAQQAIATGVTEVQLAAAPLLASAFRTLARRIDEVPRPPSWTRSGEPYETLRAEW